MITIDELRTLGGTPIQGGLGVIKYLFRGNQAYHFYSGEIHTVRGTGIHNHFRGFTSSVFKGELKNYIYSTNETDPNSTYQLIRKRSKMNAKYIVERDNISLVETCSFTTIAGQSYSIDYTTLHKIECITPKVITYLRHQQSEQKTINYIIDTSLSQVYESHPPKSENDCWEIIEDILND
jgi:hypothetical protein